MNWLLSSTIIFSIGVQAHAVLPDWVIGHSTEDEKYNYIVCSHDGLDPEYTKQLAENKCLSSAAKLGGVSLTVKQKTIDSMSGVDSSEEAQISPITTDVKCDFVNRFLEETKNGYRVWLLCRVPKADLSHPMATQGELPMILAKVPEYKKAIVQVTSVPPAEKIIIDGERGPRVIDVKANPQAIELREGDQKITVKKHKFRSKEVHLGDWKNGDLLSKTVMLEQDI